MQRRMRIDGSSIRPKPTPRRRKGMLRPPRGSPQSRPDARHRYATMDGSSGGTSRAIESSHARIDISDKDDPLGRSPLCGEMDWVGWQLSTVVSGTRRLRTGLVDRRAGVGWSRVRSSDAKYVALVAFLRGSTRFPALGRAEDSEGRSPRPASHATSFRTSRSPGAPPWLCWRAWMRVRCLLSHERTPARVRRAAPSHSTRAGLSSPRDSGWVQWGPLPGVLSPSLPLSLLLDRRKVRETSLPCPLPNGVSQARDEGGAVFPGRVPVAGNPRPIRSHPNGLGSLVPFVPGRFPLERPGDPGSVPDQTGDERERTQKWGIERVQLDFAHEDATCLRLPTRGASPRPWETSTWESGGKDRGEGVLEGTGTERRDGGRGR